MKKAKPSAENAPNGVMPPDFSMSPMVGQVAKEERRDPNEIEHQDLREEASRSLFRLLRFEAEHRQWRVSATAKAIEALRNY